MIARSIERMLRGASGAGLCARRLLFVCALFLGPLLSGADMELDRAAQTAGDRTRRAIEAKKLVLKRIAFVGLSGDKNLVKPSFQAGLIGKGSGSVEFFTRDDNEWSILLNEVEFGDLRGDVMDKATIEKFGGTIKGVQAYLYGKVLEAGNSESGAIFRASMTMAEISTGKILWSGIVEGVAVRPSEPVDIDERVIRASISAGKEIARGFSESASVNSVGEVFVFPLIGADGSGNQLSDIVVGELAGDPGRGFSIYANPLAADISNVKDLAVELAGGSAYVSENISSFERDVRGIFGASGSDSGRRPAYLVCVIKNISRSPDGLGSSVFVNAALRSLDDNRVLWAKTVEGRFKEVSTDSEIKGFFAKHKMLSLAAVAALLALGAVVGIFMFWRMMTGAR